MNLGPYRRDWPEHAVCAADDTPGLWISEDPEDQAAAALICRTCPVRLDCLDDAMDIEGGDGVSGRATVRGGLNPQERVDLHKATRFARITRRAA
jgi:hypothetical protein